MADETQDFTGITDFNVVNEDSSTEEQTFDNVNNEESTEEVTDNEEESEENEEVGNESSENEEIEDKEEEKEEKEESTETVEPEDNESEETDSALEITYEQFDDIIKDEFGGLSLDEVKNIVNSSKEQAPTFENENEQKLFDWIKENNPTNHNEGALEFFRLQSLNVDKMIEDGNFKDVLMEKYLLENKDLAKNEAKMLFESEFESKFPNLNSEDAEFDESIKQKMELDSIRLKREALNAKNYIDEAKSKTEFTQDNSEAELQASQEQAKQEWYSEVDASLGEFGGFEIEDGDESFKFEVEDSSKIAEMMKDSNQLYSLWADKNGMIKADMMAQDLAILADKERLFTSLIEHGKNLGREEISNTVKNSETRKPSSQGSSPKNSTARTMNEAIAEAILSGNMVNGPK